MADTTARPLRNEQHRCSHCGSRFEVWLAGDPLEAPVQIDVRCPCCNGSQTLSVPRSSAQDLRVENLPGPEPETGGGD